MADERDEQLKAMFSGAEFSVVPEDAPAPAPPGWMPVYLKVDFEEAREAEEWFGIYQDLGVVVRAATQAADIAESLHSQRTESGEDAPTATADDIVKQGLWTMALIAYVRCFGIGVRVRLDESVFEDRGDVIEQHRYYKNIRDKHLAHSVSPFEVYATGLAVMDPAGQEPYVFNAITVHASRSTEDSGTMRYLAELASWLQRYAIEKHHEARAKVLERGKDLTRDQIRQLRPLEIKFPQGYEAAKVPRPPKI